MLRITDFLDTYGIPYITSGNNVKEGNVNIKCPFCLNDPSFHSGIELSTGRYGCWRNSSHRGRDIKYLVVQLLDCSLEEAGRLLKNEDTLPNDLGVYISDCFNEPELETSISSTPLSIELLDTFYEIDDTGLRKRFFDYFKYKRGFKGTDEKLLEFLKRFDVRCCPDGRWFDRLIFPIYINKKLMTWQSRSIRNDTLMKHKDLTYDESVMHVKQCIYNFDELILGGKTLYITEGIFDCLKMLYYLPEGYSATCLFTKTIQVSQVNLLQQVSTKFDEVVLMLDTDAWGAMFDVYNHLRCIPNIRTEYLPAEVCDPGELTESDIKHMIKERE